MLRLASNCQCTAATISLLIVLVASACAEDSVLLVGNDGRTTVQRQGEIIDYTGKALRFKTAAGREESIAAERVVEIKTTWVADHLIGREKRKNGRLEEAIEAYQQAKEREQRPWALRQIMAEVVACHAELGRFYLAGD